jgi:hypothetical protein
MKITGGNEGKTVSENGPADNVFLLQFPMLINFRLPAKDNGVSGCHRETFSQG